MLHGANENPFSVCWLCSLRQRELFAQNALRGKGMIHCYPLLAPLFPEAARTAHPASSRWRQSRKRQFRESSAMRTKAPSRPADASPIPTSRMPGLSMRKAPEGSSKSSRRTVTWHPFPVLALTSPMRAESAPSRRLSRVDLPAPEEPSRHPAEAATEGYPSAARPRSGPAQHEEGVAVASRVLSVVVEQRRSGKPEAPCKLGDAIALHVIQCKP